MENKIKIGYPAIVFLALLLLIILNIVAAYSENPLLLNASKAIFIPLFLMIYLVKHKTFSLIFIAFLMFSFFGDSSMWFLANDSVASSSNTLYLLSYLSLIVMCLPNFKLANIDKVVGIYLLVILIINGYFLFTICQIISSLISDKTEMILFGAKSMTLIFMLFISFAVYLAKQTKESILFLMMAICFAFSDIINYVMNYYIYSWSILMIERILHIFGVFFAFKYVLEAHKISKEKYVDKEAKEKVFSGDNILA